MDSYWNHMLKKKVQVMFGGKRLARSKRAQNYIKVDKPKRISLTKQASKASLNSPFSYPFARPICWKPKKKNEKLKSKRKGEEKTKRQRTKVFSNVTSLFRSPCMLKEQENKKATRTRKERKKDSLPHIYSLYRKWKVDGRKVPKKK